MGGILDPEFDEEEDVYPPDIGEEGDEDEDEELEFDEDDDEDDAEGLDEEDEDEEEQEPELNFDDPPSLSGRRRRIDHHDPADHDSDRFPEV